MKRTCVLTETGTGCLSCGTWPGRALGRSSGPPGWRACCCGCCGRRACCCCWGRPCCCGRACCLGATGKKGASSSLAPAGDLGPTWAWACGCSLATPALRRVPGGPGNTKPDAEKSCRGWRCSVAVATEATMKQVVATTTRTFLDMLELAISSLDWRDCTAGAFLYGSQLQPTSPRGLQAHNSHRRLMDPNPTNEGNHRPTYTLWPCGGTVLDSSPASVGRALLRTSFGWAMTAAWFRVVQRY